MAKYVFKDGRFVNKETGAPLVPDEARANWKPQAPYIISDIPDYPSPITGEMISGRVARREDLKKHGCFEVGPGDFGPKKRVKEPIKIGESRELNQQLEAILNR